VRIGEILARNILFIRRVECESNNCWQAVSAHSHVIKVPAFYNCLKLKYVIIILHASVNINHINRAKFYKKTPTIERQPQTLCFMRTNLTAVSKSTKGFAVIRAKTAVPKSQKEERNHKLEAIKLL
jgi:hypothetical protein